VTATSRPSSHPPSRPPDSARIRAVAMDQTLSSVTGIKRSSAPGKSVGPPHSGILLPALVIARRVSGIDSIRCRFVPMFNSNSSSACFSSRNADPSGSPVRRPLGVAGSAHSVTGVVDRRACSGAARVCSVVPGGPAHVPGERGQARRGCRAPRGQGLKKRLTTCRRSRPASDGADRPGPGSVPERGAQYCAPPFYCTPSCCRNSLAVNQAVTQGLPGPGHASGLVSGHTRCDCSGIMAWIFS